MLKEGDNNGSSSYSDSLSSLITLFLLLMISYGYCYFFVNKLPKGVPRLISLLGVFYVLFLAPWYFPSSIAFRFLASLFISWISSFKLILFSFGKGDLILCDSYIKFVGVALFPLKNRIKSDAQKVHMYATLSNEGVLQLLALVLTISYFSLSFRDTVLTVLGLFFVIHFLTNLQLEPMPIFKQPYKATSIQDFWGRRWNRIASDLLRHTIYDPTRNKLQSYVGFGLGKMVALVVTLIVSGTLHEMMYYHMSCGMKPTWEVTKFFVLQAVCMGLEVVVKKFWTRTLGLSPLGSVILVPLTLGFVLATSYWLVYLPVWRIAGRGCDRKGSGVPLMGRSLDPIIFLE